MEELQIDDDFRICFVLDLTTSQYSFVRSSSFNKGNTVSRSVIYLIHSSYVCSFVLCNVTFHDDLRSFFFSFQMFPSFHL